MRFPCGWKRLIQCSIYIDILEGHIGIKEQVLQCFLLSAELLTIFFDLLLDIIRLFGFSLILLDEVNSSLKGLYLCVELILHDLQLLSVVFHLELKGGDLNVL